MSTDPAPTSGLTPGNIAVQILDRATSVSESNDRRLDPRLVSQLLSTARRLQAAAIQLADRLPAAPQDLVLDAVAVDDFRRLVALIREFELKLRRVDLVAVEIFAPSAAEVVRLAVLDDLAFVDDLLVREVMTSPYERGNAVDFAELPRLLKDLHSLDYWHEADKLDEQLASNHAASTAIPSQTVASLRRLIEQVQVVRDELSQFIRDNWSPADLAAMDRAEQPPAVIQTGDHFHGDVHGPLINRSTIQNLEYVHNEALRDPEVLSALADLAELVRASHSETAERLLESIKTEISETEPKRSSLKATWNALVAALGPMSQVADLATKLAPLL